jgi:hypothetical protein
MPRHLVRGRVDICGIYAYLLVDEGVQALDFGAYRLAGL